MHERGRGQQERERENPNHPPHSVRRPTQGTSLLPFYKIKAFDQELAKACPDLVF